MSEDPLAWMVTWDYFADKVGGYRAPKPMSIKFPNRTEAEAFRDARRAERTPGHTIVVTLTPVYLDRANRGKQHKAAQVNAAASWPHQTKVST